MNSLQATGVDSTEREREREEELSTCFARFRAPGALCNLWWCRGSAEGFESNFLAFCDGAWNWLCMVHWCSAFDQVVTLHKWKELMEKKKARQWSGWLEVLRSIEIKCPQSRCRTIGAQKTCRPHILRSRWLRERGHWQCLYANFCWRNACFVGQLTGRQAPYSDEHWTLKDQVFEELVFHLCTADQGQRYGPWNPIDFCLCLGAQFEPQRRCSFPLPPRQYFSNAGHANPWDPDTRRGMARTTLLELTLFRGQQVGRVVSWLPPEQKLESCLFPLTPKANGIQASNLSLSA